MAVMGNIPLESSRLPWPRGSGGNLAACFIRSSTGKCHGDLA